MNNAQYLNEVREALEHDNRRLGEVWQLTNEDKPPAEIAEELGLKSHQFGYRNQTHIRAIEEGVLPISSSADSMCRDALRGFINRGREYLSKETRQILGRWMEECDRLAANPQALEDEDAIVEKETSEVEAFCEKSGIAGIDVYTYPHYYRHPVVPKTDDTEARTYLKIGISKRDASERVMQQTTGMPEPPMILQIWEIENDSDLRETEKKIHDHLRTLGHGRHHSKRR